MPSTAMTIPISKSSSEGRHSCCLKKPFVIPNPSSIERFQSQLPHVRWGAEHQLERRASFSGTRRTRSVCSDRSMALCSHSRRFFSTELWLEGPDRWSVHDRRDSRLCDSINLVTSWSTSTSSGILGMKRHGDALYVSRDPAVDRPVVALRSIEDEPTGSVGRPYSSESWWRLMGLRLAPCRLSFTATGYGPGKCPGAACPGGGPDGGSAGSRGSLDIGSGGRCHRGP